MVMTSLWDGVSNRLVSLFHFLYHFDNASQGCVAPPLGSRVEALSSSPVKAFTGFCVWNQNASDDLMSAASHRLTVASS